VIGRWRRPRAGHFGIDVLAADLKPEMEEWIRGGSRHAESTLARLTLAPLPPKGKRSFTSDVHGDGGGRGISSRAHPRALELSGGARRGSAILRRPMS